MKEVLDQFRKRVGELRRRSGSLSSGLREASRGLTENGRVASTKMSEELWQVRNDFRDLRSPAQPLSAHVSIHAAALSGSMTVT